MQSVAVEKVDSSTEKHHTLQNFWQLKNKSKIKFPKNR